MRITLVNPPNPRGYYINKEHAGNIGKAWPVTGIRRRKVLALPPLSLLYTAAIAERDGYQIRLIDAEAEKLAVKDVLNILAGDDPDFIGVWLSLPSLNQDLHFANLISTDLPKSVVFLFGNIIRTTWRQWVNRSKADYLFYGEPESILEHFLKGRCEEPGGYNGAYALPDIQNDSGILEEAQWRLVEDLDGLPFPAWNLIPISAYGKNVSFYVNTGRGCVKSCTMCPYIIHQGKQRRARSCDSVLQELEYLYRDFGARRVLFRDPNIILNKGLLINILQGIMKRQLSLDLGIECDIELLNEETMVLCKQAGVSNISTGIESASESCLQEINQDPRYLEKIEHNIQTCRRLGINVKGFFIVGLANDSWATIRKDLALVKKLEVDAHFNPLMPYFGTKIREDALAAGRLKADHTYLDFNVSSSLMATRNLSRGDVQLARNFLIFECKLYNILRTVGNQHSWRDCKLIIISFARLSKVL